MCAIFITNRKLLTCFFLAYLPSLFFGIAIAEGAVLFRDDFNGTMEGGWTWIRENSATWSLTENSLHIELEYGDLWQTWTNNCKNLLVRNVPDIEAYTIEAHLNASLVANINQALVVLYGDDDNYLRFGLLKLASGLYVNHVHEIGGSTQPQSHTFYGSGSVYLQIRKDGTSASMYFSSDGVNWQTHHTISSLGFPVNRVGLVAFDGSEPSSSSWVEYDFFVIADLCDLEANFTSTQDPPGSPVVQFIDTSEGEPDTWHWNFGDNTTSNRQNPQHTFPLGCEQDYLVSLTVGKESNCEADTFGLVGVSPIDSDVLCVTRWRQGDGWWRTSVYDKWPSKSMHQKGCAVTSAAMLLDYLGVIELPNGEDLNPGTLNEFLRTEPDGYDGVNIKWNGSAFLDLVGAFNVTWPWVVDVAPIDAAIEAGKPVILDVGGHFVIATGRVWHNDHFTYSIQDPAYNADYLDDPRYENQFFSARVFDFHYKSEFPERGGGNGSIWVDAIGVENIDVVDSLDRHLDPNQGILIPGALSLGEPGLFDDAGPDSLEQLGLHITGFIPNPEAGNFVMNLAGASGDTARICILGYNSSKVVIIEERAEVQLDGDGLSTVHFSYSTDPSGVESYLETPSGHSLRPVFPNPFNAMTTISYEVGQSSHVRLAIHDVRGHLVKLLVDGTMMMGGYETIWDGKDTNGRSLESGVYFCRLEAGGVVATRRMVLVK